MIHELKILTNHFNDVICGVKKAEFRFADRDYKVGDLIILREFHNNEYTGASVTKCIGHITDLKGYADGYVMLSFKE